MERLVFCWYCLSYHDQTHYCTTLKIWRKIDLGNLIVFSGPTRDSVDRYKDDFSVEHQMECTLFRSRSHLNQCEKNTAKEWKHQQRVQRDEMEATEYFEKHISRFEGMTSRDSYEYLRNQNLRNDVQIQVERKVSSLQQEMQDKKEAEKWFKENMNMKYRWIKQEKYNEILREKERDKETLSSKEGVMKIVLEKFERKYGNPLQ